MNLPEGWEYHESRRYPGNYYFFNTLVLAAFIISRLTGETTWNPPQVEVGICLVCNIAFPSPSLAYLKET
jgi:hypothetical protein